HELDVEAVLLLVEAGRRAGLEAAVGDDAGRVTRPGVDADAQRAVEALRAHVVAAVDVEATFARRVFDAGVDVREVVFADVAAGRRLAFTGAGRRARPTL